MDSGTESERAWGYLGMLQQPDLPMHPRNVGEEDSEEAKGTRDMAASSLNCPLTDRISFRAALLTHIRPPDMPPTLNGTPYSPPSRAALSTHSGAPSHHHPSWACFPHQAGLLTTAAGNPSNEQSRLPIPGVLPAPQFQLSREPQRPPASLIGMLVGPTGGIKALCSALSCTAGSGSLCLPSPGGVGEMGQRGYILGPTATSSLPQAGTAADKGAA